MRKIGSILLMLALPAGCTPAMRGEQFTDPSLHEFVWDTPIPASQPTSQPAEGRTGRAGREEDTGQPPDPQFTRVVRAEDPPLLIRPQVSLSVYQLAVPAGAVSRTEAFWKRINEDVLDIGRRDILQKNGLRVGIAPMREMQEILAELNKGPVQTLPGVYITHTIRNIPLPMKEGIAEQTIYHFDTRDNLAVRTYDRADNILMLQFEPAPRKAGDVRLVMCPVVKSLRRQVRAVGDMDTREIEVFQPEALYDVGLTLDLPPDQFLIIAPSAEAHSSMSVGNAFLMHDGPAEKLERILVIIPQAIFKPKAADARPGVPAAANPLR